MKTNQKITITVSEDQENTRLDKFLAELSEISSRSFAQNLIEKNLISIDGKSVVKPSLVLKKNQIIVIELPEPALTEIIPAKMNLDIIYEDDDLLVINKPSGLVVHPAAGHQQDTLVNGLLGHTQKLSMKNELRPGIVHRIDKETSGLIVVAKNDMTHENLSLQFKNKTTHRIYYSLVKGLIKSTEGTIQSYLTRHPTDRKKNASVKKEGKIIKEYIKNFEHGKWAVTHYKKLFSINNKSYLKLKLETGRTHQIRVHMSELGHPLWGDITYGYSTNEYKKENLIRFYLHAAELGFIHPKTNQEMLFKCNWPKIDEDKLLYYGFSTNELYK